MKRSKASQASVAFLGGVLLCLLLGSPLQAQKRSGSSQITNHSAAQEWQKFEALLSGIHGQSTSVPENLITPNTRQALSWATAISASSLGIR
jgi:hypothetical protein